jgi:hypothetical protein
MSLYLSVIYTLLLQITVVVVAFVIRQSVAPLVVRFRTIKHDVMFTFNVRPLTRPVHGVSNIGYYGTTSRV